jgi:Resolvase, N terminal domain
MKPTQVALYARVSSDQQSEAKTIESQVADLRGRIAATGVTLPAELEFVDNGYSGATLIRPALERLRDVAAAGGIDQLSVHCPDRLARTYAHQVLLLEEFLRAGVAVIFLNREVGQTPEDQLLLQVQGMKALVRASENSGTEPTRKTTRGPGGTGERALVCSVWIPVCQHQRWSRRGPLRNRAGRSAGGPPDL